MPDVFSKAKRSEIMSRVKSKNTKPEMLLRGTLHRIGFRFRLHSAKLPGKPDLSFPKYRAVVFVNGCFWHGHGRCRKSALPTSNSEFWKTKIGKNKMRDQKAYRKLKRLGWRVIVVWECRLMKDAAATAEKVALKIRGKV
ncbi:MAG TPA: DNA mismatch endonuclease Vsr [Spirochaetia bacterium]|nr:DNA mismatch endonuclease Vsr [Spirochaetia bacterium]